ncbi:MULTISPECIES: glutathione S-transferase N-terminal domain-containing protein [Roseobacteraceae]|uniref:glutathione S-transferase family protein n=1 Tax=Roseobacteraceae TaxID=2854170 RepID=UPI0032978F6C
MIDFYFSPTPNGWKVAIMLFELDVPFKTHLLDLPNGDQLRPQFLAINPNGKIPAIVDHEGTVGPTSVFESGAILLYLADKFERFAPVDPQGRTSLYEWLFWQAGNQGPMAGQLSHFINYAAGDHPYALARYQNETQRNLAVLNTRLAGRDYILGDYSIADMMAFPWAFISKKLDIDLSQFPNVQRWRGMIKTRPAVVSAINLFKDRQFSGHVTTASNTPLFNQGADVLKP